MNARNVSRGPRALACVCLVAAWLLAAPPADAQGLPRPDAHGDYIVGRVQHRVWRVVDPDPGGLNLRMSAAFRKAWLSGDHLPDDMLAMPVVRRIPRGSILISNNSPAGFVTMTDTRSLPWLKVCTGPGEEMAFARANASLVQPVDVRGAIALTTGGALDVRSSPSASASTLGRIQPGERFVLLGKRSTGGWCEVLAPNGAQGYLPRSRVKVEVELNP